MNSYWLVLGAAIVTSVFAQALLKGGAAARTFVGQLLDWQTLVGLGLYGCAAMLYIVALRHIPVSVALPCTALSYIAVLLVGHFGYAEPLGIRQICSVGLIATGVIVLATS